VKIVVNGEEREMVGGASVTDLLGELKLTPDKVAIEVNRRLVRSDRYGEGLKEGDVVEVVTFVGGG
jgi:thiamine biosynthesis protein ThiS